MTPTAVTGAGNAGEIGLLRHGGDAVRATDESEGFPGVLQAESGLPWLAAAAPHPQAVAETVPDPAHEAREFGASGTEDPGTAPLADLVALLIGCVAAQPAVPSGPAAVQDDTRTVDLAERDGAPMLSGSVVASPGGDASSHLASPAETYPGVTPGTPAGAPEPNRDSSVVPANPAEARRIETAPRAGGAAPAVVGGRTVRPYGRLPEPAAGGEAPGGVPTAAVEPRVVQASTPETAESDGRTGPAERAEALVAASAPAGGAWDGSGVASEGDTAGDGRRRRDTPDRIPPHADPPARDASPVPTPHRGGAPWGAQVIAGTRETGPAETIGGLPSRQRDIAADAAGRQAPADTPSPPYQGREVQDAVVANRAEAPPAPHERMEGAQTPLTQPGVDRVAHAVRTSLARGGMEVRLRLHPESLGEVRVTVRWEGGLLSARLEAATPAARDALEGGTHALRASLQEQGIPLDRVSIAVRPDVPSHSQGHRPSTHAEPWPEPGASVRHPERSEDASAGRLSAADGRLDVRI